MECVKTRSPRKNIQVKMSRVRRTILCVGPWHRRKQSRVTSLRQRFPLRVAGHWVVRGNIFQFPDGHVTRGWRDAAKSKEQSRHRTGQEGPLGSTGDAGTE